MIYRDGNSKGVPSCRIEAVLYSDPRYEVGDYFCEECGEEGAEDDFSKFQDRWLCEECKEKAIEKNRDDGCIEFLWWPGMSTDCCCENCAYDELCVLTAKGGSHESA